MEVTIYWVLLGVVFNYVRNFSILLAKGRDLKMPILELGLY